MREGIGLATATKDADIVAGMARLTELVGDLTVLRKVLETYAKTVNVQVPAAKAQMCESLIELSGKLVGLSREASTFFKVFADVHRITDKELAEKLNAAFEKAVLSPLDEWMRSLAEVQVDVRETDAKRVVMDHYREKTEGLRDAKKKQQLRGKVVDKVR